MRKGTAAAAATTTLAVIAIALALSVHGCATTKEEPPSAGSRPSTENAAITPTADGDPTGSSTSNQNAGQGEVASNDKEQGDPPNNGTTESSNDAPDTPAGNVAEATPSPVPPQGNQSSGAQEPASPDPGDADSGKEDPASAKRWVPDHKQVWVEDSPAWTEQQPVYGYEEHSICNICGADITGSESAHGKQHMLAGQGSGHHNDYAQVIVGYNSIEHPAEGHWETVESGGHWE